MMSFWFKSRRKDSWEKRAVYFKALQEDARAQQEELQSKRQELKNLRQTHQMKKRKDYDEKLKRDEELLDASLQCLAQYDEEKKQKIDKWKEEFVDYSTLKQMERLHEEMIKKIIKEKFRDYLLFLLQVDTSKTVPITHNSWDTKEKYKIYGLLISACKVKTIEPIGIEEEHGDGGIADTTEVEDEGNATALAKQEMKAIGDNKVKRMKPIGTTEKKHRNQCDATNAANTDLEEEAYRENKKEARRLTFDMLKLLPPLVVCQPTDYNEDLQDTNKMTWNEEWMTWDKGAAPLHYYCPVLVYGNHLHVAVKGLVGNKENEVKEATQTIDCPYKGKPTDADNAPSPDATKDGKPNDDDNASSPDATKDGKPTDADNAPSLDVTKDGKPNDDDNIKEISSILILILILILINIK